MHHIFTLLLVFAVLITAGILGNLYFRARPLPRGRKGRIALANIAEGTHLDGKVTYLADAALSTRHLVGKIGSDASHVAACGTSDIPLGTITDEATAAEDPVSVSVFGAAPGTRRGVASAAITAGDMVVPAASGKLRTLPGSAGTYYICGRALTAAAADGDVIEFAPCLPIQRVVA